MKQTLHKFLCIFAVVWLSATANSMAQKANTPFAVTQQDPRIHVNLYYQKDNNAFGGLTQDYKITVQNKTNDKLHIYIDYYADLVCGERNSHQLGPLGDGYTLKPGEKIDKNWLNDGIASYVRILGDKCPKETWRETGTDKNGSKTYTMIKGLGYRIVKIINISEQERKEAEAKKQKADAEIARKEEEAKKLKAAEQQKRTETAASTNTTNTNKPDSPSGNSPNNSSSVSTTAVTQANDTYKTASQFSGGLDDVKEGEYFKDNSGNYYQKANGGAVKVDKSIYDKAQVDRLNAQLEREKAEQKEREAVYNQAAEGIANLTTNVIAGIQADRQASWERQYESTSRAQGIIDQMSGLAAEGNEEAMKQVSSAYHTLAWYNKEEKEDWTGTYSQTREKFLIETFKNTKSPAAHDLLIGFYEQQKENALARKKKGIGRGIGLTLLAGAMGYGGSVGYDKIVTYEDGEFQNETLGDIVLATGVIGGITFGAWGLFELTNAFINSGTNSEGYKEADKKLNDMKQRVSWQIRPRYDTKLNASLLTLKLTF